MTFFRNLVARVTLVAILHASSVQSAGCYRNCKNRNSNMSAGAVIGIIAGTLFVSGVLAIALKAGRNSAENDTTQLNSGRTLTMAGTTTRTRTATRTTTRPATTTAPRSPPRSTRGVSRVETDPTLPPYVARPEPAQLPPVTLVPSSAPPPYSANANNMV